MLNRKSPRFFIINPVSDRRLETRFESREKIQIRSEESGEVITGIAEEIGEKGLRFESPSFFDSGSRIQLVFSETPDNIGCFGHIVWVRPADEKKGYVCGVSIESWHGIINGNQSWKRLKGFHPKRDRRRKSR